MIVPDLKVLRGPLDIDCILLRPFRAADITADYLSWLNDPNVMRFSNQRFLCHTEQTCLDYLTSFLESPNHFLALLHRGSGAMFGTITVYHNVFHGTADIGIMVGDSRLWGRGLGAIAFRAVMQVLEDSEVIRKITAGAASLNLGMVRIMEKAGMHHEATRYAQELVEGELVDIVYYAKFCHD
ncbi:hypothetical protein AOC10_01730 [Polynucleobacter asymbioticus]|uniref:GNAT family N-acetyltransferase n=1 Tax=Polynucleobacter asymbioticus TaxID=576611 RepID=UPI0008FAFB2D|nr:GNAT family N-acetyltransferase [Polynucleobacter asymbioticus]APC05337.1 hypothetical protein AOC10_01730 [Polynucleobacter asymbioticus]